MKGIVTTAIKTPREKVLYALRTRAYRRNEIISFPECKRVLSWYKYGKQARDELLYELREAGIITIIPYHGIKLNNAEGATA